MEAINPRPLAVESFSDSWLSNVRPSLTNVLDQLENELEQTTSNSFDFDTPIRFHDDQCDHDHDVKIVHADEIFSNGLIKPGFIDPSRDFSSAGFVDFDVSPFSCVSSSVTETRNRVISDTNDAQMGCSCCLFRGQRRRRRVLFEQISQRLFGFLRRARWQNSKKNSTKVDDIDRRTMEVSKSFDNSPQTSPGPSTVYYDVESSIHEAVLHCKRSIGR